jgi:hypothetical protein
MNTNRMRLVFLIALLGLTGCMVDAADETTEQTEEAAQAPKPSLGEPVVRKETRTAWDNLIREKLPKWEVYTLPQHYLRDAPILAVPKDGRGVPVVLWFGHYHYNGDTYFTQILKSGFVSLLDLQVILHELKKYPNGHPPLMREVPQNAVNPFTQALGFPRKVRRGLQQEGEGPPVSYPGDVPDNAGGGGPPVVGTPPAPGVTGTPEYHCGGKRVTSEENCADYDKRLTGAQKLEQATQNWCYANGEEAAKAIEETRLTPSMAILCADPRARAAGAGGASCELIPPPVEVLPGETIESYMRRIFFDDGKNPGCTIKCGVIGAGAVAGSKAGLTYLCTLATEGMGVSVCASLGELSRGFIADTVGITLAATCISEMCK